MTGGLTNRQAQLLTFIRDYIAGHNGVSPSFSEMRTAIGVSSTENIHRLIGCLEERGYVRRIPHRARAIEIIATTESDLTAREKRIYDQAHAQGMKDAVDLMRESGT